jgi:hypothetical protein
MSEQKVRKFLLVYHAKSGGDISIGNVEATTDGPLTMKVIRDWEFKMAREIGAEKVVLVSYQELEA